LLHPVGGVHRGRFRLAVCRLDSERGARTRFTDPVAYVELVISLIAAVALELALVVLGARVLYTLVNLGLHRAAAFGAGSVSESGPTLRSAIRNGLLLVSFVLGLAIVVYNGRLAWLGESALLHPWRIPQAISLS